MQARTASISQRPGELFRRYVQFCTVGGSGVLVDMTLIYLLAGSAMLGWNVTLSKVIAAEIAILNNFVWNDLWTFRHLSVQETDWPNRTRRFLRFNLICVVGIGLSVILLNIQIYWLHMNLYVANLVAIVLVSVWNFALNLKVGWKRLSNTKFSNK